MAKGLARYHKTGINSNLSLKCSIPKYYELGDYLIQFVKSLILNIAAILIVI